ncbi:MAG: TIGR03364 family FAD-dependent oxidoreductase [Acidimicrobiia bacterium]
MSRVVVVGGGVIGTMHAWAARRLGHEVLHLEADAEPRRASVRNFGLVWVSGRAPGPELELALRARVLWEELGSAVSGIGFRPDGSLTVAQHPAELAVMAELVAQPDAERRGVHLLDADATRVQNPAVRGEILGSLFCSRDAVVEPRHVLPAVRTHLEAGGGYEFLPERVAVRVESGRVDDHTRAVHEGDLVVVCPGATHRGVAAEFLAEAPLRRCRLQMMQTEPLGERLTTALADGDSLRYYPAFDLPSAGALPPPAPVVAEYRAQLLVAQRASGALTIGDTHHYDEPHDFAVDEVPYAHLLARAESLLGRPLPPVQRRWSGVYSQATDDSTCVRVHPDPGIVVVTGLGGRGMTLSPAIAEQTLEELS